MALIGNKAEALAARRLRVNREKNLIIAKVRCLSVSVTVSVTVSASVSNFVCVCLCMSVCVRVWTLLVEKRGGMLCTWCGVFSK